MNIKQLNEELDKILNEGTTAWVDFIFKDLPSLFNAETPVSLGIRYSKYNKNIEIPCGEIELESYEGSNTVANGGKFVIDTAKVMEFVISRISEETLINSETEEVFENNLKPENTYIEGFSLSEPSFILDGGWTGHIPIETPMSIEEIKNCSRKNGEFCAVLHVATFVDRDDFDDLVSKEDSSKDLYYDDENKWWDVDIPSEYVTFVPSAELKEAYQELTN